MSILAQAAASATNVLEVITVITAVAGVLIGLVGLLYTSTIATRTAKIGSLEDELKKTIASLIDEKLKAQQAVTDVRVGHVERQQDQTAIRCSLLESKDNENFVKLLKEIHELRDVVATKGDLTSLRSEMRSNG